MGGAPHELEHVPQRYAGGHLDHHGARDRAGDGEHDGAGLVVQAGVAVAVGADAGGDGQLRERLCVRQQRGRAADAGLRRADLAAGRDGRAAVDGADERGRGPGHHAYRIALHARAKRRSAPVAQAALGQRGLHGPLGGLTRHADDQGARAHGLRGQQGAVQDEVRGTVDEHRVLAAGGFVLASVDDHHGPDALADGRLGDRAQFLGEGKPAPPRPFRLMASARPASCSPPIGSSGPCTLRCMGRSSRSTRSKPDVSCGSPTTRTSGTSGRASFT